MIKLSELYKDYPDILIKDIKINSKDVNRNDIFVCTKGVNSDKNDYIEEAIRNGAVAVITNKKIDLKIPVIIVEDIDKELIRIAKKIYNYNENNLELIATTGTNGKTTIASIISDMIGNDICGYMGTNGIKCSRFSLSIKNTTPGAERLFKYFEMFHKNGCKYLSMEASSEAFFRKRLEGIYFKIGIFSNISEDHLNVHKSIDNYILCKQELFKRVRDDGFSILNIDDKYYNDFVKVSKGTILTYGKKESDLQIIDYKCHLDHTFITLKYKNNMYSFSSPLLGEFNIYNLCAAMLSLSALNYDILDIIERVSYIKIPKGRVEFLNFGQKYSIILDYAHTTDALLKVYKFLNSIKKEKIITVIGSAGGREKEKRKYMGKVILDNSDYVIFTMDDPRCESVNSIIDDLVSISDKENYIRIIDRKEAIYKALEMAKENDIVLIAGKGIDNYMAIGDDYLPYCDLDVIKDYFNSDK